MKTLYVARHATAEPESPTGHDFDRRLAMRGEIEIGTVAARARDLGRGLDLIVASPAARALATAGAYQRAFDLPDEQFKTARSLYTTETGHLADLVQSLPGNIERVMIVGHNPVISRLGRWLADHDDFAELIPATVVVYEIDVDHWADAHPSLARLVARLSPLE
jgi:phosphohistidine phosphatase